MADLTKAERRALEKADRAQGRLDRVADAAMQQGWALGNFGLGIVAGAGAGYYMARTASQQWWGIDKEIWLTAVLGGLGFVFGAARGKTMRTAGRALLGLGTGVGAAYAYGAVYQRVKGSPQDFS